MCPPVSLCVNTTLTVHTIVIVIHAYDVSLRASKEKEQQLQSQLTTVKQESQDKQQKLEGEMQAMNLHQAIDCEQTLKLEVKQNEFMEEKCKQLISLTGAHDCIFVVCINPNGIAKMYCGRSLYFLFLMIF